MVHCRRGSRLRVAATVTTARTRSPASSRARCASRAVAPVVSTSSQSTIETAHPGPDERPARRADAPPSSRTGWPPAGRSRGRPGRAPRPRTSSSRATATGSALAAKGRAGGTARSGASGRARGRARRRLVTAPARARSGAGSTARPTPPAASVRPSGAASAKTPCSLWASTIARSRSSYSPAAKHAASPSGQGVGRTGPRRWSGVSSAQPRHSDVPARRSPRSRRRGRGRARRRARTRAPRPSPVARRTGPADACGAAVRHAIRPGDARRSAHVRRREHLRVGARPVAVAAERVEPLVGGDQPQRQVGVGRDHDRRGGAAEDAGLGERLARPASRRRR